MVVQVCGRSALGVSAPARAIRAHMDGHMLRDYAGRVAAVFMRPGGVGRRRPGEGGGRPLRIVVIPLTYPSLTAVPAPLRQQLEG